MIYLSGLVGFLLVLTAEARVGNSSQVKFCTETEQCLLFDVICETDDYQVRHYDSVKWVSTEETAFMERAIYKGFRRLFEYISGANENRKKIEMTSPVLVKVPENSIRLLWEMRTYTVSFLLPAEHQANPPKPTDKKVYIHEMPDMKVYVLSYGGWIFSIPDALHAKRLSVTLELMDAKYETGFHYSVGYNGPMTIFNRHNEVWYVAEDDPVCSSSEEFSLLS